MAKEVKDEFDVDLDDDLDFEGGLDFNLDDSSSPKDRSPVTSVVTGFKEAAYDELTDRRKIAEFMKDTMPGDMKSVVSDISSVADDAKRDINNALKDVKPQLHGMIKDINKVLPPGRMKNLVGKLRDKFGIVDERTSQVESRQSEATASLDRIFNLQAEQDAKTTIRSAIDKKIDRELATDQHLTTTGFLSNIDAAVTNLNRYQSSIGSAYQRKSLELKYKSIFLLGDILETNKQHFKAINAQNEIIIKNTALPEYVKLHESERFGDIQKQKIFGALGEVAFGDKESFKDKITKVKDKFVAKVQDIADSGIIESAAGTLESVAAQSDQLEDLAESGAGIDTKAAGYEAAGASLVSFGLDYGLEFVQRKMRERIEKSEGGQEFEAQFLNYAHEAGTMAEDVLGDYVKKHDKEFAAAEARGDKPGFIKKRLKEGAALLRETLMEATGPDLTIGENIQSGMEPVAFDNATRTSITTVIPGFLARMLRELTSLRTGDDDIPMMGFNAAKGTFVTESSKTEAIKRAISGGIDKEGYQGAIDNTVDEIVGDGAVSEDTKAVLRMVLEKNAFEHGSASIASVRDLLGERGDLAFKGNEGALEEIRTNLSDRDLSPTQRRAINDSIMYYSAHLPDIRGVMQVVKAEHGVGVLSQMGLIKTVGNTHQLDMDEYERIVSRDGQINLEEESLLPSGGEGITIPDRPTTTQKEPEISVTDLITSIDATTTEIKMMLGEDKDMNGKVDLITDEDTTTYRSEHLAILRTINESILSTSTRGVIEEAGEGRLSQAKSLFGGLLSASVDAAGRGVGALTDKVSDLFGKKKSDGAGEDGEDDEKASLGDRLRGLIGKGAKMAGDTFEFASKSIGGLMANALPPAYGIAFEALNQGRKKLIALKDKILKFTLDRPMDVYVPGFEEPVLSKAIMKLGGYFDQKTGDPINSLRDIKGPIVDAEGNVVLSLDMIKEGLFDSAGNNITGLFGKIKSLFGRGKAMAMKVFGKAKARVKGIKFKAPGMDKFKLRPTGVLSDDLLTTISYQGDTQIVVLEKIFDLLDKRIPKPKEEERAGSFESILRKRDAKETEEKKMKAEKKRRRKEKEEDGGGLGMLGMLGGAKGLLAAGIGVAGALGAGAAYQWYKRNDEEIQDDIQGIEYAIDHITGRREIATGRGLSIVDRVKDAVGIGNQHKMTVIRYAQYGFGESLKDYWPKMEKLETYLIDAGLVKFEGSGVSVELTEKAFARVADILGFELNDQNMVANFTTWFNKRFRPVLQRWLVALKSVGARPNLDRLDKIDPALLKTFMNQIKYPNGPYDITASPVPEVSKLLVKYPYVLSLVGKIIEVKPITPKESVVTTDTGRNKSNVDLAKFEKGKEVQLPKDIKQAMMPLETPGDSPEIKSGMQKTTYNPRGAKLKMAPGPIMDPEGGMEAIYLYGKAKLDNVNPQILKQLFGMAKEYKQLTGKRLQINDGFRTDADQRALRRKYGRRAAPVGRSLHQFGLALDAQTNQLDELDKLGLTKKYGFIRPIGGETWHIEPSGIQSYIQEAKMNPAMASALTKASLGRGGGGIGSKRGSGRGRDAANARAIFESGSTPTANLTGEAKTVAMSAGTSKYQPVLDVLDDAASTVGVEPTMLKTIAAVESSLDPNAVGTGRRPAVGLMQHLPATFKENLSDFGEKYGLSPAASRTNPRDSAIMGAAYIKHNFKKIEKLVSKPGTTEAYLILFLGPSGARKFLINLNNNPDDVAAIKFTAAANNNKAIFFNKGGKGRTYKEVYDFLTKKLENKAKEFGITKEEVTAGMEPGEAQTPITSDVITPPNTFGSVTAASYTAPMARNNKLTDLTPIDDKLGKSVILLEAMHEVLKAIETNTGKTATSQSTEPAPQSKPPGNRLEANRPAGNEPYIRANALPKDTFNVRNVS